MLPGDSFKATERVPLRNGCGQHRYSKTALSNQPMAVKQLALIIPIKYRSARPQSKPEVFGISTNNPNSSDQSIGRATRCWFPRSPER
jgi:hypothetical protein